MAVQVGLQRVSYSGARAVLDALPEELRKSCKVNGLEKRLRLIAKSILDDDLRMTMELPLKDGTTFTWILARPQAVLRKMTASSPALQRVLRRLEVANSYDNPLSIVHYHDEVTSGNLLAPVHSRSFSAYRFTVKEFGRHLLSCQQMWFEFAILRSSILDQVVGGVSYVQRRLMHEFFTSTESFRTIGVHIEDLGHGPTVLFGQNKNLIADMEASQSTFDLKGSSGMIVCIKCANCVKKGVQLPDPNGCERSRFQVTIIIAITITIMITIRTQPS